MLQFSYNIERRHVPNGRWLKCNFTDVTNCQFEVTGLAPSDTYEFRVMAKNAVETIGMPSEVLGPIQCQPSNGKRKQPPYWVLINRSIL